MNVVATVFIALGLAADAFAVSISSGLRIKHIKLNKVLKIAVVYFSLNLGITLNQKSKHFLLPY